jgi:uncharacterized membrane protein
MLPTVSDEEIRAAQIFTGATFALWLVIGYVPAIRRYANIVRAFLLGFYLFGCVAFVAYIYVG